MAVVEYCMLLKRMVLKNSQLAEVAKGKEKKELDRLMRDSKVRALLSEPEKRPDGDSCFVSLAHA